MDAGVHAYYPSSRGIVQIPTGITLLNALFVLRCLSFEPLARGLNAVKVGKVSEWDKPLVWKNLDFACREMNFPFIRKNGAFEAYGADGKEEKRHETPFYLHFSLGT